jgi:hypothetical protein
VQQTLSPYATAGVAIVGAGLVAVTPVAAPGPDLSDLQSRAVRLAADGDAFIDQFNAASDNLQQMLQNFGLAPGVGLQQAIVNQADFMQQIIDDPSSLPDVTEAMQENLKTVLTGFTGIDMSDDTQGVVFDHTLEGLRSTLVGLLPGFLPDDIDSDTVSTLLGFLSSPLSGILIGMAGPFISPFVALANSISDGDGFGDTVANTIGAFFNGADLDLDSLIPQIEDADILPGDFEINHLDLALGGLFSPGEVTADDYAVPTSFSPEDDNDLVDFDKVTPVGGSIFNSLGADIGGVPVLNNLDLDSHAIGPLGALIGASQTIGILLGDGWDASGGKDEPFPEDATGPALPPLLNLIAPMLPDGFFGDGYPTNTEAVTPFSDMLSGDGDTFGDLFNGLF